MLIYNVLFKGVETYPIPWCLAFLSLDKAKTFIENDIKKRNLEIHSEMGFEYGDTNPLEGSWTDFRCEDKQGHTFYYVVYVQKIK